MGLKRSAACMAFALTCMQMLLSNHLLADEESLFCSSIDELQMFQHERGPIACEVDFEVQLTFAASDFDVFFCQDGIRATMVYCNRYIGGYLAGLQPGDRLRVRGNVPQGERFVRARAVELIESPAELKPHSLTELDEDGLPINGLATVTARVKKIVHTQHRSYLLCHAGYIHIEVVIDEALPASRVCEWYNKTVTVYGAFAKPGIDPNIHYQLFVMSSAQLQLTNSEEADWPPLNLNEIGSVEGRIVFSDGAYQAVLHDGHKPAFLNHRLPKPLAAGQWVKAYGNILGESTHLEANLMFVQAAPNKKLASEIDLIRGVIREISEGDHSLRLKISDKGDTYHIEIPLQGKSAPHTAGFRIGDAIACSGVLCRSVPASFNDQLGKLTPVMFASGVDAVTLKGAPLTIAPSTVLFAFFCCSTVILGIVLWNRSLTRLVRERTRRLSDATQHLMSSFETIPKGFLLVDASGKIAAANNLFWKMFDLTPQEDASATVVLQQLISRDDWLDAAFEQLLDRCQLNRLNAETQQLRNCSKATFDLFTGPIIDREGRWIGRLWSFEDVTDKLNVERRLIQAQKMEVVGKLAGGIAHDFNNLLSVIHTSLDLISRQITIAGRGEQLEDCLANFDSYARSARLAAQSSSALTQHLLDFTRQSDLELVIADAREIIDSAIHLARRTFDPKIEIKVQTGTLPLPVKVDAARLQQAILNCLVNSRDALPDGGVIAISAGIEKSIEHRQLMVLSIVDNGCGMPPEIQERAFEPFFTTKKRGKGTGLGLSTAYGVIEQFEGQIKIQSALGKGTSVRITLPLCQVADHLHLKKRKAQPLKILVIDDEELQLENTLQLIESLGQQATCFGDGQEALAWLQSGHDVDMVLLDVRLEGLQGAEVFANIRELRRDLRVVVCSGGPIDCSSFLVNEYDLGNIAFIQKPYRLSHLEWQLAIVSDQQNVNRSDNEPVKHFNHN